MCSVKNCKWWSAFHAIGFCWAAECWHGIKSLLTNVGTFFPSVCDIWFVCTASPELPGSAAGADKTNLLSSLQSRYLTACYEVVMLCNIAGAACLMLSQMQLIQWVRILQVLCFWALTTFTTLLDCLDCQLINVCLSTSWTRQPITSAIRTGAKSAANTSNGAHRITSHMVSRWEATVRISGEHASIHQWSAGVQALSCLQLPYKCSNSFLQHGYLVVLQGV